MIWLILLAAVSGSSNQDVFDQMRDISSDQKARIIGRGFSYNSDYLYTLKSVRVGHELLLNKVEQEGDPEEQRAALSALVHAINILVSNISSDQTGFVSNVYGMLSSIYGADYKRFKSQLDSTKLLLDESEKRLEISLKTVDNLTLHRAKVAALKEDVEAELSRLSSTVAFDGLTKSSSQLADDLESTDEDLELWRERAREADCRFAIESQRLVKAEHALEDFVSDLVEELVTDPKKVPSLLSGSKTVVTVTRALGEIERALEDLVVAKSGIEDLARMTFRMRTKVDLQLLNARYKAFMSAEAELKRVWLESRMKLESDVLDSPRIGSAASWRF